MQHRERDQLPIGSIFSLNEEVVGVEHVRNDIWARFSHPDHVRADCLDDIIAQFDDDAGAFRLPCDRWSITRRFPLPFARKRVVSALRQL